MKLFVAAMLTLFAIVQSNSNRTFEEPAYTLAENQTKDKSFEVRIYKPSTWIVTNYTKRRRGARIQAFMSLRNYIQGQNNQGAVIPMTIPVLTTFIQPECFFCERVFEISFYLPKKYQAKPPVPTNPNLSILHYRKTVMYTSSFRGLSNKKNFKSHSRKLLLNLKRNGITDRMIRMKMFYGAIYDNPMRVIDGRNEVWIEGISNN